MKQFTPEQFKRLSKIVDGKIDSLSAGMGFCAGNWRIECPFQSEYYIKEDSERSLTFHKCSLADVLCGEISIHNLQLVAKDFIKKLLSTVDVE